MTVAEMIEKLNAFVAADPKVAEMKMIADGCDCWGEAGGVRLVYDDGAHEAVLLERIEHMEEADYPAASDQEAFRLRSGDDRITVADIEEA